MAVVTGRHPAVAAAVRAHELVTAAIGDTVSVDFGPVLGQTTSLESVVIGYSTEDAGAITGQSEADGPRRQADSWEIGCMAQVVTGDVSVTGVQKALDRVFELMAQVGAVLLAADEPGTTWQGVVRHQVQWIETDNRPPVPGVLLIFHVAGDSSRSRITR